MTLQSALVLTQRPGPQESANNSWLTALGSTTKHIIKLYVASIMPLMTYINDRMTTTYMMLKSFSKLFLVPLVNITLPLLHQHFPMLTTWQNIDIIVRNISAVVNTCVDIINRQQVKDIYTYSKYGLTLSLLLSTYQTSCLKVLSSK